jgi:assimilatory nitrate reductase catalytic subunit
MMDFPFFCKSMIFKGWHGCCSSHPGRKIMKTEVKSTCCYCGVGCGVLIETEDGEITGVRGDPDHIPPIAAVLCTKGQRSTRRPTRPIACSIRRGATVRGQPGQRISWEEALDEAPTRFAETIRGTWP